MQMSCCFKNYLKGGLIPLIVKKQGQWYGYFSIGNSVVIYGKVAGSK